MYFYGSFVGVLLMVQRNKTLLKDYEQSRKASTFVDKRIGEGNDELGEYEKAIMRLQRERQVQLLKSLCILVNVFLLIRVYD